MKNFKLLNGLSFLLALMLFNCTTPTSLLEHGEYDEAVYKAIMNLQKSKKKKEKDIIVVEEAFRKITAKDMAEIAALMARDEEVKWVKINALHNDIKERQDLISPYLPLKSSKTHYIADFRFVNIIPMELDSRYKAAEYYYTAAQNMLAKASTGDKNAARNAFRKLTSVQTYFDAYKDTNELADEAFDLGHDKVLFEIQDKSYGYTPHFASAELRDFDERSLNDTWIKYYTKHNAPENVDYRVVVDIVDLEVSPEFVEHVKYEQSKKLFKTVSVPVKKTITNNANGNPGHGDRGGNRGDREDRGGNREDDGSKPSISANNDKTDDVAVAQTIQHVVKEDKKVPFIVKARVKDTRITKGAFVSAQVRFYDAKTGRQLSSELLSVEENFLSFTSTFRGDKRALTHEVLCRVNANTVNIPRDSEMLLNATYSLKDKIRNFVRAEDSYVML